MENNSIIIGIDHIGLNVPDIDVATVFLQQAFNAEVIYESYTKQQAPLVLPDSEAVSLNLTPKAKLNSCRMIKIGNGVNIELFEIHVDGQKNPVKSSDLGLQHFALYTDNIYEAIKKFEDAGGAIFSKPKPILFPLEERDGNFFCYGLTPWGTTIEFITYPDGMPYEEHTDLRRWKGGL